MFGKALGIGLICMFVGCGGGQKTSDTTNTGGPTSNGNASTSKQNSVAAVDRDGNFSATPPAGAKAVSTLYYSPNRMLFVGYRDGHLASIDVNGRTGDLKKVTKGSSEIAAVSNDGVFTVVNESPPAVVRNNGSVILQMNQVKTFESARFGADGTTLYVAEPGGKIRIWGQAHSFEESGDTEKMEEYLNRQAPDFHVEFKSVGGPFVFNEKNIMFVGDGTGVITMWDPLKPSAIKKIMKLSAPVRSIDATDRNIVATSSAGQLKVGILDPPSYLPWSREAKGDYAAVDTYLGDNFVSLTGSTVALRSIETGEPVWSKELGAGSACGLDVSPDGRQIVACVSNAIVILNATDGAIDSWFYAADSLKWATASGETIK